jgi:hypothetical protein
MHPECSLEFPNLLNEDSPGFRLWFDYVQVVRSGRIAIHNLKKIRDQLAFAAPFRSGEEESMGEALLRIGFS